MELELDINLVFRTKLNRIKVSFFFFFFYKKSSSSPFITLFYHIRKGFTIRNCKFKNL